MNYVRKLLVAVGALYVLGGGGMPTQAVEREAKAREAWMAGYVKLEEGGRAEESGDTGQALTLYREALSAFQDVRRNYPSWNPSLLGYRITFCTERIRRLESKIDSATVDMSQEELAKVASRQVASIRALAEENRMLKEKLALTGEALERARRESARTVSTAEEVKTLVNEGAELKTKNTVQRQQIEQLNAELERLRSKSGIEEVAEKLKQDLERTRQREVQLEKAFETYRKAYENVNERFKRVSIDREKLVRLCRDFKDRADQAAGAAEQARQQTQRLEKALAETQQQHDAGKEEVTRKDTVITQLRADRTRLETELDALRKLRDERAADAAERQQLVSRIQDLLREKEESQRTVASLRQQRQADSADSEEGQPSPELAALRRDLAAAQRQIDALRQGDGAAVEVERVRTLKARCDALEEELRAAKARVARQEDLLASQGRRLADAETIGNLLKQKERVIEEKERQLQEAREGQAESKAALAQAQQQVQDLKASTATLTTRLDTVEKRNAQLGSVMRDVERSREDRERTETTLREQLEQSKALLEAVEAERNALRQKGDEQLALLRQQEKDLRKLETGLKQKADAAASLERTVTELEGKTKNLADTFEERVATMKAKTEVVDGLTASLADADAQRDTLRRNLAVARKEKADLETRFAEAQQDLAEKDADIRRYQKAISTDVSEREKRLTDQIAALSSRLEREEQRRRSLEKAIASAAPLPEAGDAQDAPVVLSTSGEAERDRRQREQRALVRGYLRQAVAAEKDGKIEAARWNYQNVLEHDDGNKLAAQRLGLIAADHGDNGTAVRYLRRAFKLDPDDLDTILPLGFALLKEQQADLGLSMLSRAVALQPDNPVAHRCLGIACSSLGWYDAAEVQFRRAHGLDEDDGESAFNLAVLLATREPERLDEARIWYKKAVEDGVARDPGLDRLFGLREN